MFRKTKIAAVTAVVLGLSSVAFAPAAQAVSLNENGGTGQVLIFPYYNVNNDFQTSFNITNTTGDYKAVKVRFRESKTSNDVFDFNLYMSPHDMFTMNLKKDSATGGVRLTTNDKSCTFPEIPAAGELFKDNLYDIVTKDIVREGYLEVIEMGVVPEELRVADKDDDANEGKYVAKDGILHEDGVPKDCGLIRTAWDEGVFIQGGAHSNSDLDTATVRHTVNPNVLVTSMLTSQNIVSDDLHYGQSNNADGELLRNDGTGFVSLEAPTGGLVGSSVLIDFKNLAGFVVEPTSVENYSNDAQHYLPFDAHFYLLPSLASGTNTQSVHLDDSFVNVVTTTWEDSNRDFGLDDMNIAPNDHVPSGINPMPMAHALAVTKLSNQYFVGSNAIVTAATDWVVTAPMRKHAIFNGYQYYGPSSTFSAASPLPADAVIVDMLNPSASTIEWEALNSNGYWDKNHTKDVRAAFVYYDREEGVDKPEAKDIVFSPPRQENVADNRLSFANEVNITSFKKTGSTGAASVLGSVNSELVSVVFDEGWGSLEFSDVEYDLSHARYSAWGATAATVSSPTAGINSERGVPLLGFTAASADLGSGVVGETFPHTVTRTRGN